MDISSLEAGVMQGGGGAGAGGTGAYAGDLDEHLTDVGPPPAATPGRPQLATLAAG